MRRSPTPPEKIYHSQGHRALLAIEADALIERRIERKIKDSRLPERKLLSDFDFAFQKGHRSAPDHGPGHPVFCAAQTGPHPSR